MNFIVCGPPGSGKTTYVKTHRSSGDLVVDIDAIAHAITGLPFHEKPENLYSVVMGVRDYLISRISRNGNDWYNSWVIMGGARASDRIELARTLNAEVIVLEIDTETCVKRIQQDKDRADYVRRLYPALIEKWWRNYQPDERDTKITLRDQQGRGA